MHTHICESHGKCAPGSSFWATQLHRSCLTAMVSDVKFRVNSKAFAICAQTQFWLYARKRRTEVGFMSTQIYNLIGIVRNCVRANLGFVFSGMTHCW